MPGSGLVGCLDGHTLRLGRPGFIDAGAIEPQVRALQGDGATVVLVERDGETLGAIAVRDELRPDAPGAVETLHSIGMRTAMLTGDNEHTAHALATRAGIATVFAELLPTDKVTAVERLQRDRPVAMVGDGINDAPALASANVGIAMGAMGTDVAIEAADVALMGDDLRHLPDTLLHARRAGGIMRQNLLLSGGILLTLIPLAATGVLGLAAVVAVQELAEVIVIANGIRAGRRTAFSDHAPLEQADSERPTAARQTEAPIPIPLPVAVGGNGCQDDCCKP